MDKALIEAAWQNNVSTVKQLLEEHGANIEARNRFGSTVLTNAACNNSCDVIKLLVDKGANLEARNNFGATALEGAAWEGKVEAAKELIAGGAQFGPVPSGPHEGRTPYELMCGDPASSSKKDAMHEVLWPLQKAYLQKKEVEAAVAVSDETFDKVTEALAGAPDLWGAIPSSSSVFKRPNAWSVASPLVDLLKLVQADGSRQGMASFQVIWTHALPLGKQMFAKAVPLIAASDEAQRALRDIQ